MGIWATAAWASPAVWSIAQPEAADGEIVVDGARCAAEGPALVCPAKGPLSARWVGDPGWVVEGQTTLEPGETGWLWVVADDAARVDVRATLAADRVTAEAVWAAFSRVGAQDPPAPSWGMLADLHALAEHPDLRVRAAVVEALFLLVTPASFALFPPDSEPPVSPALLLRLAEDPSPLVRARLATMMKEVRPCGLTATALTLLEDAAADPVAKVRRAALMSLGSIAAGGATDALVVWSQAVEDVGDPGPRGRAAVVVVARLAKVLPAGSVDAGPAIREAIGEHPERAWLAWHAWRHEVPLDHDDAVRLLRGSVGMAPGLIRHWAQTDPGGLAAVFTAWAPAPTDPRLPALRDLLSDADPAVVLALP